jgi:hypothetical protein
MTSLSDAFAPVEQHPWENKENPQKYNYQVTQFLNPNPQRHILGLVGGNEVSLIKGNMVDLESDLRGINIPNTFCPWRQYQPPEANETEVVRSNVKTNLKIDVRPQHLPTYQMWAYPGMPAPVPLKTEVCNNPEKY